MFDFYGPKVINNTRGVDPILGSRMIFVQTQKMPLELRGKWNLDGSEPDFTSSLRNELHVWGMSSALAIDEHYQQLLPRYRGDRRDEIIAPLVTIAELSDDVLLLKRLLAVVRRAEALKAAPLEPVDLLREALINCVSSGFTDEVALPHVQLQLALLAGQNRARLSHKPFPFWMQSQWIGNNMDSYNFKEKSTRVRRARLYGRETRIYKLRHEFVVEIANESPKPSESLQPDELPLEQKSKHPFAFCESVTCFDCPFAAVCEETVPGLKALKQRRLPRNL